MTDPVVCSDGFTYERSAIVQWLQRKLVSPMTRQRVSPRLHPNHALRQMIEDMRAGSTVPASELQPSVSVLPGGGVLEGEECMAVQGCRRLRALLDGASKMRWRYELLWWLVLRRAAIALGWPPLIGKRGLIAEVRHRCVRLRRRLASVGVVRELGATIVPFLCTALRWTGIFTLHAYAQINLQALVQSAAASWQLAVKCLHALFGFQ